MNRKEEERFLVLRSKMWDEVHELEDRREAIEAELRQIDAKHNYLINLLDGSVSSVEDLPAPEASVEDLVRVNRRKERTENNKNEKAELDEQLIGLLDREPGLSRKEIQHALNANGWSNWDLDKAMKRCARRGAIVREGATNSAKWYAGEDTNG
jgi:uncharacterized protein YPO0396